MAVVLKQRIIGSDVQPMRFSLVNVQAEADEIIRQARRELDSARAEAQSIVRQAEGDADQLKRGIEQESHRIGLEKSSFCGKKQIIPIILHENNAQS